MTFVSNAIYTVMVVLPIFFIPGYFGELYRARNKHKKPTVKEWFISLLIIEAVLFILAQVFQRL
jgi:hypothetical protein